MLLAVKQNADALQYASSELQGNIEVALAAMAHGDLLTNLNNARAPVEITGNREAMLASVRLNGRALKW